MVGCQGPRTGLPTEVAEEAAAQLGKEGLVGMAPVPLDLKNSIANPLPIRYLHVLF